MGDVHQRKVATMVTTEEQPLIGTDGQIKLRKKTVVRKLYTWEEIPEWQKDNEHIHTGYVRETSSVMECIRSLFYLHNETVNIYSHLIPAIAFFSTIFFNKYVVPTYSTTTMIDYLIIDIFFLGAFSCLILSSTFHCLKSHSLRVAVFGNKLDYLGIVFLIVASMVSILYYGFHGNPWFFGIFSLITMTFGAACAVVSLKDTFRSREWRPYRAALFVIFGLSAVLPILAGLFKCLFNQIFNGRSQIESWEMDRLETLARMSKLLPILIENVWYIFPNLRNEHVESQAEALLNKKRLSLDELVNFPYDLGPFRNAIQLLGTPPLWLYPFSGPQDDGLHFQKNEESMIEDPNSLNDIILCLPWPPDSTKHLNSTSEHTSNVQIISEEGEQVIRIRTSEKKLSRSEWLNDWGESLEDFGVDVDVE
ncbi:Palmitoyltransferase PFA4 [Nakaseomyces glabratus]|nr:Palmitoyltransferase PFA4 [Nakaseomyces glabratus]KTB24787.1 Palmitoyltransferase PFA4 [Nakaseomyces glabratus]